MEKKVLEITKAMAKKLSAYLDMNDEEDLFIVVEKQGKYYRVLNTEDAMSDLLALILA